MDEHVKVEATVECDPTCNVLQSNQFEAVFVHADLHARVKHEDSSIERSDQEFKFEASDMKLDITNGSDDIYMKHEPLEIEELQIKDESGQSSTYGTTEKSTQFEYFCCGLCNSKFSYKNTLQQHMKIHMEGKLFKCSVCDYRCREKDTLLQHIKSHTREKRFKCNICGYRYKMKSYFLKHFKKHIEERPLKCSICDYRCIQKSDMLNHIKTHMKKKSFNRCSQKSNMSTHKKTDTTNKPFKCVIKEVYRKATCQNV